MAEKVKSSEHAADSHLEERKARTRKWWRRGFAGLATSVITYAAGIGAFIASPLIGLPISLALFAASGVSAVYGVGSAAIGTGSGISNALRKK